LDKVTADELYFSSVAKWGYCNENRTPFKEICKIPANTCMSIEAGFTPTFYQYTEPLKPVVKPFKEAIVKAVERRMISDIPVALLCSGGLDSTIILKLVQGMTDNYKVFTVPNGTDAEYICYLQIPDEKLVTLDLKEYDMNQVLGWNEGPVDLGSVFPQYALSEAIWKEGYNVVLSGDGADELFGGYGRARKYDSQYSDIFHELVFYHLPRLDKLMMKNTIELRCPYLSRDVIQGALSVVRPQRTEKQYLKNLFMDIVPKEILERKKEPLKTDIIRDHESRNRQLLIRTYRDMEGV
jgi:asparagine synthase (glutamine-hydrolysing)